MKIVISIITCCFFFSSCSNHKKSTPQISGKDTLEKQRFFPVTDYLEGEVYNIKKSGVNPLKYTTIDGHIDSVWIKIEEVDSVVAEFLQPDIDTTNLVTLFSGKSFLDQSIGAATLTYDPVVPLPDSMKLKHWDVYIDPKTNKVTRVFMIKEPAKNKTLQLTWLSGQSCKITTIGNDANGVMKVEKEEKLIWDF
jgi:hypothetical protein